MESLRQLILYEPRPLRRRRMGWRVGVLSFAVVATAAIFLVAFYVVRP